MLPGRLVPLPRRAILCLAAATLPGTRLSAEEWPLAILGYDPVAYFTQQRAVRGEAAFELVWDEQRYRFVSAAHREMFRAAPTRYAPQFDSFCAMALTRGEVDRANPEYWLVSGGRLYLFGKPVGPELFQQSLAENQRLAERNRSLIGQR
jgi:hypothetical protein